MQTLARLPLTPGCPLGTLAPVLISRTRMLGEQTQPCVGPHCRLETRAYDPTTDVAVPSGGSPGSGTDASSWRWTSPGQPYWLGVPVAAAVLAEGSRAFWAAWAPAWGQPTGSRVPRG